MELIPTFACAKRSDVRDVVAAMPGVVVNHVVERHRSHCRMPQPPGKILGPQRSQQYIPAMVERFEQCERNLERRVARVLQVRPKSLVVRPYRWFILGEGKLESHVRVHVAVRNVMDDLPDGPAAGTIGGVKLLLRE